MRVSSSLLTFRSLFYTSIVLSTTLALQAPGYPSLLERRLDNPQTDRRVLDYFEYLESILSSVNNGRLSRTSSSTWDITSLAMGETVGQVSYYWHHWYASATGQPSRRSMKVDAHRCYLSLACRVRTDNGRDNKRALYQGHS